MQLGDSDPKCCNYANELCKPAKFLVLYGYHSHSMTNNKLKPSKYLPSESYRHIQTKKSPFIPFLTINVLRCFFAAPMYECLRH